MLSSSVEKKFNTPRSDTEVSQVGSSLPWFLLKGIVFGSAVPTMAQAPLNSEPKPTLCRALHSKIHCFFFIRIT